MGKKDKQLIDHLMRKNEELERQIQTSNYAPETIATLSLDEAWAQMQTLEKHLATFEPERLKDKFGSGVIRIASVMAQRYEEWNEPYTEARHHLRYLTDLCDVFAAELSDTRITQHLNSHFEQELSGTWYGLLSASSAEGIDLREIAPTIAEGVEARLKALHELIHKGNSAPLREIVKIKLNLDSLPRLGRKSRPTPLTAYILTETRRLAQLHGLKTRGQKVERLMQFLEETYPDVLHWKTTQHQTPDEKTSVQLQAYIVFHRLDRMERREKLKEMEANNPNF